MHPTRPIRLIPILVAAIVVSGASVAAEEAASTTEAPLRIGIAYRQPEPASPAARLYTEEGFETDFAKDLARELRRPVEIREIARSEVAEAIAASRIDAALSRDEKATPDTIDTGYGSAFSVAMRSDTAIREWSDLADRTVCVSVANREGQALAASFGARLRVEPVPALSLMRVRTGECDAAIHDAVLLQKLFRQDGWTKFSATLPPLAPSSLRLAVADRRRDEVRAALDAVNARRSWEAREQRWAQNVAFEIYLDQEAPDCH